jgi:hypothetical protein
MITGQSRHRNSSEKKPAAVGGRGVDRAGIIRRLLAAHQTRVLILDEVQHICHTRSRDRAVVLDTIKAISTTSQINIICAGTPSAEREFSADPQIERRFSSTRFTQWSAGPAIQRFVATYERARPLRLPSNLSQPDMIKTLLREAGGITHRIMQCLNAAAMVAIHEGLEKIDLELLKVNRCDPGRVLAAQRSILDATQVLKSLDAGRAAVPQ